MTLRPSDLGIVSREHDDLHGAHHWLSRAAERDSEARLAPCHPTTVRSLAPAHPPPTHRKQFNPQAVIGGPSSYQDEHEVRAAEGCARAERTRAFVEAYGERPMRAIDGEIVREYRRASRNDGTIPALRAFFNDAMRPDAGWLVTRNPFAGLRIKQSRGRRDVQPPAQKDAARLVALADELTPPSFAAYLHTDAYEGVRPGELDALRWDDLDFTPGAETILIEAAVERTGARAHAAEARVRSYHRHDPAGA